MQCFRACGGGKNWSYLRLYAEVWYITINILFLISGIVEMAKIAFTRKNNMVISLTLHHKKIQCVWAKQSTNSGHNCSSAVCENCTQNINAGQKARWTIIGEHNASVAFGRLITTPYKNTVHNTTIIMTTEICLDQSLNGIAIDDRDTDAC